MAKDRLYTVLYRERGNKDGEIFETSITADNLPAARSAALAEFSRDTQYVMIKVYRDYLGE